MSEEPQDKKPKAKSGLMLNIIVSAVIGLISGGAGFATLAFLPGMSKAETTEVEEEEVHEELPAAFVTFGEVIVNLDDGRLNRYLRMSMTLQVAGDKEEDLKTGIEEKQSILRNWLISYLSDLQLEDIRGAAGQNRIRREIQNQFNVILSPDGFDLIDDVLFQDFTIQ